MSVLLISYTDYLTIYEYRVPQKVDNGRQQNCSERPPVDLHQINPLILFLYGVEDGVANVEDDFNCCDEGQPSISLKQEIILSFCVTLRSHYVNPL